VNITQQQFEAGLNESQFMIQGMESQIGNVISSAIGEVQNMASAITSQLTSFPGCATQQTANVQQFLSQIGKLL